MHILITFSTVLTPIHSADILKCHEIYMLWLHSKWLPTSPPHLTFDPTFNYILAGLSFSFLNYQVYFIINFYLLPGLSTYLKTQNPFCMQSFVQKCHISPFYHVLTSNTLAVKHTSELLIYFDWQLYSIHKGVWFYFGVGRGCGYFFFSVGAQTRTIGGWEATVDGTVRGLIANHLLHHWTGTVTSCHMISRVCSHIVSLWRLSVNVC